ncbi:hypothetical protein BBBOND_0211030 [Babesia bigemina]|uniref:Uncharacterized protein n=1 Tax=Babesia bigemina TaxID=5866 RepID=A0A061D5G2_BABBI|nr:hypothetical protein BBBOND_0211030 [Babesia bigemina]CDR95956.1 hypothetical protein BBBOND_0211030 [Babesia bigemina]|eukprot:XP_012768142.1 hypothetical protein BBBOND_0211030 [Babesia bigemina]
MITQGPKPGTTEHVFHVSSMHLQTSHILLRPSEPQCGQSTGSETPSLPTSSVFSMGLHRIRVFDVAVARGVIENERECLKRVSRCHGPPTSAPSLQSFKRSRSVANVWMYSAPVLTSPVLSWIDRLGSFAIASATERTCSSRLLETFERYPSTVVT